ncbi:MAG: hypothetical protein LT105_12405 [Lentimicrobium sp.]|nr:hypothetical protein [Lentimicrobium sp.]
MKRIIMAVLAFGFGFSVLAQPIAISFSDFSEIAGSMQIQGFSSPFEITEEEDEFNRYAATFLNTKDFVYVKLDPRKGGVVWQDTPYKLGKWDAEYAFLRTQATLAIDLPAIEAILMISSNKFTDQADLEAIARQTGLLDRDFAALRWPDEIPEAFRPECVIVDVERVESSTEGYTTEYFLTVLMSEELKKSVKRLRSQYEDNGHYIVFSDKSVLTSQFGHLDDLDTCCRDDEKLVISFQIP